MNKWVIERLDPNDGDDVEWEQWNIGIDEEGYFRVIYSCFSEEDATRCVTAVRFLETFEDGRMFIPEAKT